MDDHDLLHIELEALWGHLEPIVAIAVSPGRHSVRTDAILSGATRRSIADCVAAEVPLPPDQEPAVLGRCAELASEAGELQTVAGPSYLVPPDVSAPGTARIVRSDSPERESLWAANPGNWTPQEWTALVQNALGPWAMALEGDRVISICHSPVWTDVATDAGVWTDPEFRAQGHAAAVTAAWAQLVIAANRLPFYSTGSWNVSSQAVARRLGLRPIGWLWQLRRA